MKTLSFGREGEVELIRDDAIATLRVNRPHRRNALARTTMTALGEAVSCLEGVPRGEVKAVVLCGAGDRFIAGGDLYDLAALTTAESGAQMAETMQHTLRRLEGLPMPIIAAIDGHALGGGAEVALACDLRLMAPGAIIGFRQIRLAVTTAWGAARRLRALVGPGVARRLLWTGEDLTASEALSLGLVEMVAPEGQGARVAAEACAHMLAERDFEALAGLKAILQAAEPDASPVEAVEREIFGECWGAEPHLNIVEAWLERSSKA
ncbi:MAG: enoyl-CoA hydratase/isomerase family protein [Bradymonadia bacterium]